MIQQPGDMCTKGKKMHLQIIDMLRLFKKHCCSKIGLMYSYVLRN